MTTQSVASLLDKAFALHQSGRFAEAESFYLTVLDKDRANAQVLSMLGMLHMQQGNWEEGVRLLNISLGINQAQPDALNNLGYALQTLERYDDALTNYDKAIALYPGHVSAYYNRGITLQNLQRYQDAVDSFQKGISLRPEHVDSHVHQGNAYACLKRYDEALVCYQTALNLRPDDAGVLNNLGLMLTQLKRDEQALTCFRQAVSLKPDYVDAHLNLAVLLQDRERYEEALASLDKVIAIRSCSADVHCRRGRVLQSLGRYDEAAMCYRAALDVEPDHVSTHVSLGVLCLELGKGDQATDSFIAALSVDPECSEAYHNLSMQGYFSKDGALFEQFGALYARCDSLPVEDQIYLNFAMGNAMSGMGRYDEAFDAYQAGNRLYHRAHAFDEAADENSLDDSISFFTTALFDKCQEIFNALPPLADQYTPVFIVGMPRSGTTLIEQILSSHPAVMGAGELKIFDVVTAGVQLPKHDAAGWETALVRLRELGRNYLDQVCKLAPDARFITDKMPGNFLHLGLLYLMLPQAKIVHALRDPVDSCFSCYTHHFRDQHDYAYDLGTLGRYYRRYMKLMQHWRSVLPSGQLFDVHYEEVVADPEREARRLLDYLGLPWDDACLKFYENKRPVLTASLVQVRKPIYTSSVARWKRFEKHLGPLLEIVGSAALPEK